MMTREEALAFKARYDVVNAFEIDELRSTSVEVKIKQTEALMASVSQFGWEEGLCEQESEVRDRWVRLKGMIPWAT
ncbi:MAG TPA: hypothetical protein VN345_09040 [Blastocatellia bacterium]|jgi:hypothetical protein|nr:hypothetical protein [Blastocatellia bacterium]